MGPGTPLPQQVVDAAREYVRRQVARGFYPRLNADTCQIVGACDCGYNCIAWSIEYPELVWPAMRPEYWWPLDLFPTTLWPDAEDQYDRDDVDVAKIVDVPGVFIPLYLKFGYQWQGAKEPAPQAATKDAVLYCDDGMVTHAARRDGLGPWTSKLGFDGPLVQHTVAELEGGKWGTACHFFRKTT